jgi:hypothetical protein
MTRIVTKCLGVLRPTLAAVITDDYFSEKTTREQ